MSANRDSRPTQAPDLDSTTSYNRQQLISLALLLAVVSAVFIAIIRPFIVALFLAAIFSAFSAPLYQRVLRACKGRSGLATALTLAVLIASVITPAFWVIYIAAEQAAVLADAVIDFVQRVDADDYTLRSPEWLPYGQELEAAGAQVAAKLGELVGGIASFLVSSASAATRGTASFFLSLFIMVYAMSYFLHEEQDVVTRLMRFTGLPASTQSRLSSTIISVSGATLRGTLVISVIQGVLGGLGFAVAGVQGAAFWGLMVALVSMLPGIGPTLVWVPIVIYVFVAGETTTAIALAVWCTIVVSTIDNVLRPVLVGQDTQMSGLMVLISTLGGIAMFGVVGFIIGPVIAGLLIALWEISREDLLSRGREGSAELAQPTVPDGP